MIPFNPPRLVCRRSKLEYHGIPDGRLNKPFWEQAETASDFRDIEGDKKPRPLKKTEVRMLWDDDYLYIGAKLWENEIWATVNGRDEIIFADNDFEVFLAPKPSTHRYYEIELNALGSVWDLMMDKPARDLANRITGWDIRGLKSAVYIDGELNNPAADNRYWSVEMLIPWLPLRECEPDECLPNHLAPHAGEIWRLNFSRVEYQTDITDNQYIKKRDAQTGEQLPEYNWVWAPTGIIDIHMPELWGYLMFGADESIFDPPGDEDIRWALRRLFYRQRNYGACHGRYTVNFEELRGTDEWLAEPEIYATPNLFEISMPASHGRLHIRQDGFLWREDGQ